MHCTALRVLIWLSEAVNKAVNRNAKRERAAVASSGIKRFAMRPLRAVASDQTSTQFKRARP
ncbi:hypothetical protein BWU74_29910 [Paraburkholderia caledonica]|nr:hypothetical protein BWU74_29910 [Burkholderia sp. Bk]